MLTAEAERRELVVWTRKSALDEAKSLFSRFGADFRTVPCPRFQRETKSEVFVLYGNGGLDEAAIESALHDLESCDASTLILFMPGHSSDFAFRMGTLVGRGKFGHTAEWAFNMNHFCQLLKARNVAIHNPWQGSAAEGSRIEMAALRKRLGLSQVEIAGALGVTSRTVQSWEKNIGTSQLKRKLRDLIELMTLMDEYVSAPREQEWLSTPLPAFHGETPRELIVSGRVRDLVVEFLRMREGQPA